MNSSDDYDLRPPATEDELRVYHEIRRVELFEPRMPHLTYDPVHPDERAPGRHPLALFHRGKLIGTARVDFLDEGRAALRLVAISRGMQGMGHGRVLMSLVEDFVRRSGRDQILIHASNVSLGFYRTLGYVETEWDEPSHASDTTAVHKQL